MGVETHPTDTGTQGVTGLGACELRERIGSGALRATELARACLGRVAAREPDVQAWAALDEGLVLAQAERLDLYRSSGLPLGPLHGLPVGIKDIIDTEDLPTANGNALDAGRRPEADAWLVSRLRAAGAIVFGKTVTAECAYLAPGRTRNPHDPARTPGGSSSGSAAAVAAGMVPLAVGTQTGGSVIRPASYCGVVGFKPTFGLIPRSGVLRASRSLDTVGTFGRSLHDVALLADVLAGQDAADPDTALRAAPRLLDCVRSTPPVPPQLAFVRTDAWQGIEPDCAAGFRELVEALGGACDEFVLPGIYAEGPTAHRRIMQAEMAHNLRHYYDRGAERLAPQTRELIEQGRAITASDYLAALDWRGPLYAGLEEVFARYDAVITPATAGEAPQGLESTGSAAFNVLWSLLGVPAVTLPLLEGANGMPIGVQLVGQRHDDGRLLRTAGWLVDTLANLD